MPKNNSPIENPEKSSKVQLLFRVEKPVKIEVAVLAARSGHTQQELLTEALNDLLIKYGRNPIA